MVSWIWCVVGCSAGLAIGYWIAKTVIRGNCAGTLRVDRSDPDEAPYLFLEVEPGGMELIHKESIVIFKVDLQSYLARK